METYCHTCQKQFNTLKDFRNHRNYMRSVGKIQGHEVRTEYSMATPSLSGENSGERMEDFQIPERQTLGGPTLAFQPASIIKPQPRIN